LLSHPFFVQNISQSFALQSESNLIRGSNVDDLAFDGSE